MRACARRIWAARSPEGERIISGVETRAWVGPTIAGQRLTTELWTKPNRRKALRPICGIKSLIGLARPPRGREYWRPRAPLFEPGVPDLVVSLPMVRKLMP